MAAVVFSIRLERRENYGNSKAMNGAMPGSVFKDGLRLTEKLRLGVNVLSPVLVALMAFFTVKRFRKA